MPLVTLTVRAGKSSEFKVHGCSMRAVRAWSLRGVPEKDRFQRVLELDADDFRFDPEYPDLHRSADDDFVLIEILLSVGAASG